MNFTEWWKAYSNTTLLDRVSQYTTASNAFFAGHKNGHEYGRAEGIKEGQAAATGTGYTATMVADQIGAARLIGYEQGHAMGVGVGYVGGKREGHIEGLAQGNKEGLGALTKARQIGYDQGRSDGFGAGKAAATANACHSRSHAQGYTVGYAAAKETYLADFANERKCGYAEGFAEGKRVLDSASFLNKARAEGHATGFAEGRTKGYDHGTREAAEKELPNRKAAFEHGLAVGTRDADNKSYNIGYDKGHAEGQRISPNMKERVDVARAEGYNTGHEEGYKLGNRDGMGEMGEHITEELRIAIEDRLGK